MTAQTFTPRNSVLEPVRFSFHTFTSAALTTGTYKSAWSVPRGCRILEIFANSVTAGSGGTSDIIDINVNGTTIFTTQANRPTLLSADTGAWTMAGWPDGVTRLRAGDILSYDIDQVASTGSSVFTLTILLGHPV